MQKQKPVEKQKPEEHKENKQSSGMPRQYKYLGWLTVLYITFVLVSNVTAGKIVQIGVFTLAAPIFFFPITYIIADILTEVYGYSKARSVVWMLLACTIIAGLLYALVAYLPPAKGFDANDAYVRVLGQVPRILMGSWIAIYVGGILNDYTLAKMKLWTKGKHLWTRTIGSTFVGEGADTVLFFFIALYGVIPNSLMLGAILSGWLIKVAVEVIMTPVTYYVIGKLKKAENVDYYDYDTDFNPFILKG